MECRNLSKLQKNNNKKITGKYRSAKTEKTWICYTTNESGNLCCKEKCYIFFNIYIYIYEHDSIKIKSLNLNFKDRF